MKTETKKTRLCSVAIHATYEKGYNILCLHRYDDNDQPLRVLQYKYRSDVIPQNECFSTIENVAAKYGHTITINEQDHAWYHGIIA